MFFKKTLEQQHSTPFNWGYGRNLSKGTFMLDTSRSQMGIYYFVCDLNELSLLIVHRLWT